MCVRQIILLFIACAIVGCASHPEDTCTLQVTGNSVASLGSLHTRNCIVRLEAGGKFSVLELNGSLIALSLNIGEFQEKFPKLYKDFDAAVAKIEAGEIIIDASMGIGEIQVFE